jgi:hypothetical protein
MYNDYSYNNDHKKLLQEIVSMFVHLLKAQKGTKFIPAKNPNLVQKHWQSIVIVVAAGGRIINKVYFIASWWKSHGSFLNSNITTISIQCFNLIVIKINSKRTPPSMQPLRNFINNFCTLSYFFSTTSLIWFEVQFWHQ